ncbi:protein of unknown function - conserved [Leishmania donovani]|uniref:C2_domain_containing_protein_putative/Pfam:PF0016 8 n=1 Tax=Leishmania donovani TaxID=5661 RepID=A0A6J8F5Q7_LEIDO|nr:protein of unknown function - conserved [Leishmania donovani]VDZ43026.1 C2_domain_containing_protein_putative/Pfam:PF00168 [Leishmania donovani]
MVSGLVELEILRGKNYPQTEDDPNPCTTQVTVSVADALSGAVLSPAQLSSIQQNSNAPFYNDTLNFRVEDASEDVCLSITVIEHSRRKMPFVLFYGKQIIGLSKLKAKQRFVIPLFSEEEGIQQVEIGADTLDLESSGGAPFLSARVQFTKDKIFDKTDPYSDVDVSGKGLSFDGKNQLVPEGTQYVWLRLKSDKKWTNSFQYELSVAWRSRAPLETEAQGNMKSRKGITGGMAAISAEPDSTRTLGDIIIKKWCCRRTHQVLTRVCITAEKYGNKVTDLTFTPKEEVEFRTNKKERCVFLEQICKKRLEDACSNCLREWLNRLWILFVTGVDSDPAGPRALSYEVRKAVHDAQFTEADAIILQACLLFSFIPSLKYEVCQALSESDYQAAQPEKKIEVSTLESPQRRVTPSQETFTHVFISFVGSLLDTLTEAEIAKAAAEFKPAIWDAQQRIAKGAKSTIGSCRKKYEGSIFKGSGIHIDHLDKLGRRKQVPKFV